MKLFKSLLVAPASLGLLAPMAATANEVTINDFNAAEEIAVTNSRVDGLEARLNNFEAGSFSETTTASFKAAFVLGSEDSDDGSATANDTDDAIQAGYSFGMKLTTSFTGEDKLVTKFDAGNSKAGSLSEFGLNNTTADALIVDGISYTFPIGNYTAFVGDTVDGGSLFTIACAYGGPSDTLDDCGNVNSALGSGNGTAAGASFDIGNGFTAAIGYTGEGSSQKGLLSKESADAFGGQLTYTGDSYGLSATYANIESNTSAANSTALADSDVTYWALNGYWTPSESGSMPSISVGYETGDSEAASTKDTSTFFVGLQWDEVGPGTFGAAMGTTGHISDGATEYYMYEAFYSYPVNDGMTITPGVFIAETAGEDDTGFVVTTSFSF